jgi:hypothetical protein
LAARLGEQRPFVGTWRLESPPHPHGPHVVSEMDLLPDGTMHDRAWDSRTGGVLHDGPSDARWRVSDGRFQHVIGGYPVLRAVGIGPGVRVRLEYAVTWEGPDRFRLETGNPISAPTVVWSRVAAQGR